MPEWRVQLVGEPIDLGTLHREFGGGDPDVLQDEGAYWLRVGELNSVADSNLVRGRASEIVAWMNGAVSLHRRDHRPVSIGRLLMIDDSGKRHPYLEVQSTVMRVHVSEPVLLINGAPTPLEHRSLTYYRAARTDPAVAEALSFYVQSGWIGLYKVYEIMEHDVGGRNHLARIGAVSDRDLGRFTWTANHPQATGPGARHARSSQQPPANPMSIHEAQTFIGDLLERWIAAKQNTRRRDGDDASR